MSEPASNGLSALVANADRDLLVRMPSRGRVAVEILLVLALVLGGNLDLGAGAAGLLVLLAEIVAAVLVMRPWSRARGHWAVRVASLVVAILTVVAPALVEGPGRLAPSRRLGVEIVEAPTVEEVAPDGGVVEITHVVPRSPADGVLHAGDRIVAIGGSPLARGDAPADLARQVQSETLPVDTTVTLLHDGARVDVPMHVPRTGKTLPPSLVRHLGALRSFARNHVVLATAVRDAIFIAFLLLLVRRDGQPLAALGMTGEGAWREVRATLGLTGGVFATQIVGAILIAALGALSGFAAHEGANRLDTLGHLTGQGTAVELVGAVLVAAAFEEIAFRGFLMPRVRSLTGSWILAAVVVSALFGLGHIYEGTLAVFQTALLGLYFSAVFLVRRRALGVTLAHAAFNLGMFLLVRLLLHANAFEHVKSLAQ